MKEIDAAIEALEQVSALIKHQYTASRDAMTDLQYACDASDAALAGLRSLRRDTTVPDNMQEWAGMDGAIAFHLIDRHADGWSDVGKMMNEWLYANTAPEEAKQEPVIHQHGFAKSNEMLRKVNESLDKQLDEVMRERDERDDVIDKLLDIVLGTDRYEWSSHYGFTDAIAEVEERMAHPAPVNTALQDIEQYRMQMAGICTAAIGYWKESDSIHPDYDTPALRDVARLYANYAEARAQNTALLEALKQANSNHEEFERKWYLACDLNEQLLAALKDLLHQAKFSEDEGGWDFEQARAAIALAEKGMK